MSAYHSNTKKGTERTCIPTGVEAVYGFLSFGFPLIASIDVAYEMISNVVANMQLKEMAKLAQFAAWARSGQYTRIESHLKAHKQGTYMKRSS